MKNLHAVVFGEILWDLIAGEKYLGGAPFNFAAHFVQLGNRVEFISAIGNDELGEGALTEMQKLGVTAENVTISHSRPTGTVTVSLRNGQPDYTIHTDVAWDFIQLCDAQIGSSAPGGILYFGTLAQRSAENRQTIGRLLAGRNWRHVFCDLNLRQPFCSSGVIENSIRNCSILKMNALEAAFVARDLFNADLEFVGLCPVLAQSYGVGIQLITCGSHGVYVFENDRLEFIPAATVQVCDTVGAGDAFSAAFMHAFYSGFDPLHAAQFATQIAAFVVGRPGAVPQYSPAIKRKIAALKMRVSRKS